MVILEVRIHENQIGAVVVIAVAKATVDRVKNNLCMRVAGGCNEPKKKKKGVFTSRCCRCCECSFASCGGVCECYWYPLTRHCVCLGLLVLRFFKWFFFMWLVKVE